MSPAHPVDDAGPDLSMGTAADERPYVLQPDADFRHVGKHAWTAQRLQSGRGRDHAACMVQRGWMLRNPSNGGLCGAHPRSG